MINPGKHIVVSDWNPHYAGLSGAVGDLYDERQAIVRLNECPLYPQGTWAIIDINELEAAQ